LLGNLLWLLSIALATSAVSWFFAGRLKLRRDVFLIFYIPVCAGLFLLSAGIGDIFTERASVPHNGSDKQT
jgi:hypothetical protein